VELRLGRFDLHRRAKDLPPIVFGARGQAVHVGGERGMVFGFDWPAGDVGDNPAFLAGTEHPPVLDQLTRDRLPLALPVTAADESVKVVSLLHDDAALNFS